MLLMVIQISLFYWRKIYWMWWSNLRKLYLISFKIATIKIIKAIKTKLWHRKILKIIESKFININLNAYQKLRDIYNKILIRGCHGVLIYYTGQNSNKLMIKANKKLIRDKVIQANIERMKAKMICIIKMRMKLKMLLKWMYSKI